MNTVAGAIASWDAALRIAKQHGGQLSLARLLRDAGHYANEGVAVTFSQVLSTTTKFDEVAHQPGFAERFLPNGKIPEVGALFRQPKLARVFELLARDGLDSFYRGALAEKIAEDFRSVGALLSIDDLNEYQPRVCQPLQIEVEEGTVTTWYRLPKARYLSRFSAFSNAAAFARSFRQCRSHSPVRRSHQTGIQIARCVCH